MNTALSLEPAQGEFLQRGATRCVVIPVGYRGSVLDVLDISLGQAIVEEDDEDETDAFGILVRFESGQQRQKLIGRSDLREALSEWATQLVE